MTGDLHPHGQNSPDIPMSSIQNFFTLRFHFRRDIGMAGAETRYTLDGPVNASNLRVHHGTLPQSFVSRITHLGNM